MNGFIDYLDRQIEAGRADIKALSADGRKDDSNFAKIRTNIYEVCKTVTLALIDRPGMGAEAVKARFESFRAVWGAALEKAKEHGDVEAAAVEETKLAALADVTAHFPEA